MQMQLVQQAAQERVERRQQGRRRSAGAATYRSTRGLRALPASNLPGSLCGSYSAFLRTQHRIAGRFQEGVDETREFALDERRREQAIDQRQRHIAPPADQVEAQQGTRERTHRNSSLSFASRIPSFASNHNK